MPHKQGVWVSAPQASSQSGRSAGTDSTVQLQRSQAAGLQEAVTQGAEGLQDKTCGLVLCLLSQCAELLHRLAELHRRTSLSHLTLMNEPRLCSNYGLLSQF